MSLAYESSGQRPTAFVWKAGNIRFTVHGHISYKLLAPEILRRKPRNTCDNEKLKDDNCSAVHLVGVTVLEFESSLTFYWNQRPTCLLRGIVLYLFRNRHLYQLAG